MGQSFYTAISGVSHAHVKNLNNFTRRHYFVVNMLGFYVYKTLKNWTSRILWYFFWTVWLSDGAAILVRALQLNFERSLMSEPESKICYISKFSISRYLISANYYRVHFFLDSFLASPPPLQSWSLCHGAGLTLVHIILRLYLDKPQCTKRWTCRKRRDYLRPSERGHLWKSRYIAI